MRRRRARRVAWVAVLATVLATTGCVGPDDVPPAAARVAGRNQFRRDRPLVIPHGGGDGLFPEDTMYAYTHSFAMGGDVVDADVQVTADGIPIAFHDSTLDRTTDGTGRVRDWSFADLAPLDAGYDFGRDGGHPFRGKGITIPSIESLLQAFPDTLVTLDLKDQRTSAVAPLCELLVRLGRTGDVYIGVDTTDQVAAFRRQCPAVRTSGTDDERAAMRTARDAHDDTFESDQLVSQPSYLADDGTSRITADYLSFAHRLDIAVLPWTVDDPADMRALIALGVDGIYTRRPDVMIDVLDSLGLLGTS